MRVKKRKNRYGHTASLCMDCARGASECEWMRRLKPIEGWRAQLVEYREQHGRRTYTYHVINCPRFVPCRIYYEENK